jgi:hypothetical protein
MLTPSLPKIRSNNEKLILVIIVGLAAVLRLYKLGEESLWFDEIGHLQVTSMQGFVPILEGVKHHRGAAPLDYLILHAYLLIIRPHSEFGFRLPYAVYGVLSVASLYFLGKKIHGTILGLSSALLLTVSPAHIAYSQEVRFYSLSVLLAIISTIQFIHIFEHESSLSWILYGLYSSYLFAFVMIIQGLYYCLHSRLSIFAHDLHLIHFLQDQFSPFLIVSTATVISFLPWIVWAGLEETSTVVGNYEISISEAISKTAAFLGHTQWLLLILWIISLMSILAKPEGYLLIGLSTFPLIGAIGIDVFSGYFYHPRQIIVSLPFFYLALLLGSIWLSERVIQSSLDSFFKAKNGPILLAIITSISLLIAYSHVDDLQQYYRELQKRDWHGLVDQLLILKKDKDQVFVLNSADDRSLSFYLEFLGKNDTPSILWAKESNDLEIFLRRNRAIWIVVTGGRISQADEKILHLIEITDFERFNYDRFVIYHYPGGGSPSNGINLDIDSYSEIREPLKLDQDLSNKSFVWWPRPGPGGLEDTNGYIEIPFEISDRGKYCIWGFVQAPNKASDSFFISIDSGKPVIWDLSDDNKWTWNLAPSVWELETGEHRIRVQAREKGARLQRLMITKAP